MKQLIILSLTVALCFCASAQISLKSGFIGAASLQGTAAVGGVAFGLVQSTNKGSATATATHGWQFPQAASAGNLLVATIVADDYMANAPSGWAKTEAVGEDWLGAYIIYKVAAGGETGFTNVIGSATGCTIWFGEYSGMHATPYDKGSSAIGQGADSLISCGTTAATTQGNELCIAVAGIAAAGYNITNWTQSFVAVSGSGQSTTNSSTELKNWTSSKSVTSTGAQTTAGQIDQPASAHYCGVLATFKKAQ
jgi:hypothetical protein